MPSHSERMRFSPRIAFYAALLLVACAVSPGKAIALSSVSTMTGSGMSESDQAEIQEEHNRARARVGVGPLSWNARIADMARRHAETLADTCLLAHSGARGYGENLFVGTAGFYTPADGVRSWLDEARDYDYRANSGHGRTVGHYTQVVWRESTELGCGCAVGCGNLWMVCNYSPPGNYFGRRPY